MSINLTFTATDDLPGGFVAEYAGYLCFIEPDFTAGDAPHIFYRWIIQEGGGWTHQGGATVNRLCEDIAVSAIFAEEKIKKWLEEQLSN